MEYTYFLDILFNVLFGPIDVSVASDSTEFNTSSKKLCFVGSGEIFQMYARTTNLNFKPRTGKHLNISKTKIVDTL